MTEYLLIPFNKKDEIKKDYPIKWDVAKKKRENEKQVCGTTNERDPITTTTSTSSTTSSTTTTTKSKTNVVYRATENEITRATVATSDE